MLFQFQENETLPQSHQTMTWEQVECSADVKEIFCFHISQDVNTSVTNSELIVKEQVEVFLDTFIKEYHGSSDILYILQSLITYTRQNPSFEGALLNLKWLKCKKNLERKLYALCNEKEMLNFPQHIRDTIPANENCSNMEQYPDNFSKLMHLMILSLQMPLYYNAFKTYCISKPALRKYITEDAYFTDEMIGYVCSITIIQFSHSFSIIQVPIQEDNILY